MIIWIQMFSLDRMYAERGKTVKKINNFQDRN